MLEKESGKLTLVGQCDSVTPFILAIVSEEKLMMATIALSPSLLLMSTIPLQPLARLCYLAIYIFHNVIIFLDPQLLLDPSLPPLQSSAMGDGDSTRAQTIYSVQFFGALDCDKSPLRCHTLSS
jgi:hypothetical protein